MISNSYLFLPFILIFVLNAQQVAEENDIRWGRQKKPLTFLVYIAADNDLAPFVQKDIEEMKSVGSTANINILVYLITTIDGKKITKKLLINKNQVVEIGSEDARDSGDPQTLIDACAWAHQDYPSKKFALVLWDHGSGSLNRNRFTQRSWLLPCQEERFILKDQDRAVCYDDTSGNYLTDWDLISALSEVCKKYRNGEKIDILAFDACLMADIEIAYAVAPYTRFMVASQETVPGKGYGYQRFLNKPAKKKLSIYDLARRMVRAHRKEYEGNSTSHTMSALDLAWLPPVVSNVNKVSSLFSRILVNGTDSDKSTIHQIIHESKSKDLCVQFSRKTYLDLDNFYTNLIDRLEGQIFDDEDAKELLIFHLRRGRQKIRNLVIGNVYGKDYNQTCGLSIYFRRKRIDYTYPELYWSKNTEWLEFLNAYDIAQ